MAILNDIASAIGRALASTTFAMTVEVTDNTDVATAHSPAPEREGAKVDHVPLINRLSHIMSKAPDGIYLRVTVPDVNFTFAMVPGGAVLVGAGPLYHGETIDLSDTVPRLTMRRISPGAWCDKTTVGVFYWGGGTFDFIGEGREMWTEGGPLWLGDARPFSSGRCIDGLGPRTTGVVCGIFDQ
ncbi:hypothetical protein [Pelagimonas varians]|uniref:Uncharacterized protein n=1 Tax=Pelagimonas varians TaxID=696760 RepID=A0A238KEZ0_9RHOB|nr:hypothetical protein [Pelagimonas varians]PYG32427.1 hypothetical protein C8N36_103176 [Pelagimonas varians]SMX41361.1 hypothetical protein PEV8663_02254 [Pelagimonas varians]